MHGIACGLVDCKEGSVLSVKIAVFGERRVKLFNLRIEIVPEFRDESQVCFELTLFHSLPKFSHWVLDVCFFKVKERGDVFFAPLVFSSFFFLFLFLFR